MTKTEFLALLEQRLMVLNDDERADLLSEYEQHIEMKVASGAVLLNNGQSGVFVFHPQDSTVQFKKVDVLRLTSDGQTVIISPDIQAGDIVISAGVHSIHEGEKVRPLPAQTSTNVGGLL